MHNINLFGHEIFLKDLTCALNGSRSSVDPYVNIYVRLTNVCNARCSFCSFHGKDRVAFDRHKFWYLIHEIFDKVKINKISFTGGEPTMNMGDLRFCLREVKKLNKDIFTVLSTNGYGIGDLGSDRKLIDSIALSRHHYDDKLNAALMGGAYIELPLLTDDVHITCNLVKGYVDSKEECHRFITEMGNKGFTDIGFVSLMGVNDYSLDHSVRFSDISLEDMPDTIKSTHIENGYSCRCANYLTSLDDGTIVKSYSRHVYDTKNCEAGDNNLVFDLDKLKVGFNGRVIYE